MTLQQLADTLGATLEGDGNVNVGACASIENAGPEDITFLANRKYLRHLTTTKAAAVIVDSHTHCPEHLNRLICEDPYFTFRNAAIALHGFRSHPRPTELQDDPQRSVSPQVCIHPDAELAPDVVIHPHVTVEHGAKIGSGTILYPGCYIGPDVVIGDDCVLFPNVVVYDKCLVGNRVTIHANSTIGQDGFGYATHMGKHHKIPQAGIVVIEDDVEIGAGCAIERAAIGETRIGEGTKFADLISIGHGTTVGKHCLFVSLVGVSGSVQVGNYVVLGGQVGVTGHLKIGDGVQAAGKTAIARDVPPGMRVGGQPAVEIEQAKRNVLAGQNLYSLVKRVRQLEREVKQLREEQPQPHDQPATS